MYFTDAKKTNKEFNVQRRDFVRFAGAAMAVAASAPLLSAEANRDNFVLTNIRDVSRKMLEEIYKSNDYYKKSKSRTFFQTFTDHQRPRVTLVGCSDSRFQMGAIDETPENDIFVVRNIGNQFASNPGSIEYGVRHLHTPLLIILGHTRCGAVKAAMSDYSSESLHIKKEVDSLSLSIKKAKSGANEHEKWLNAVLSNVHQQVADATVAFAHEVNNDKLTVVGMVYDFANDLREGHGAIKIVNVNGETDMKKVRETPIFRSVLP